MRTLRLRRCAGLMFIAGSLFAIALASPASAATSNVTIKDFSFQPGTTNIPVGGTVTWTNQGPSGHTTTSDKGLWDSGTLDVGQSFSFTFKKAGTFSFHCRIHPYMQGKIVVGNPAPKPKTKTIFAKEKSARYLFSPKAATIKVGTQVKWKNVTDTRHTVTSNTKAWKFDKNLGSGKTLAFVFKKAGTFKYHCRIHPYMKGTIQVKR